MTVRRVGVCVLGLISALACRISEADCKLEQIAQLPVVMDRTSPLVSVKINGAATSMIVDTGAFFSMLTPGKSAELKLHLDPAPAGLVLTGVGGYSRSFSVTKVREFELDGAFLHNVEFIVGGNEWGYESAGLLGQNLWSKFDTEIDLADGVIRLFRTRGCGKAPLAYWSAQTRQPYSVLDIESDRANEFHVIGRGSVNGSSIRVMFDTGASTSMLSLSAAARAGIKTTDAGVEPAGEQYGIGTRYVPTWIAPVSSFKLGDNEEIKRTHLRLGGDSWDEMGADMLLGADFFLSHRVFVSLDQHRVYFSHNGGPVFNLTTTSQKIEAPASLAPEQLAVSVPTSSAEDTAEAGHSDSTTAASDAANFSRLGMSLAARHEYAEALADLDRACALAPKQASYLVQRGQLHVELAQPELALKDLDAALALDPGNMEALLQRARLHLEGHQAEIARVDLDAAAAIAVRQSDARFEIAELYQYAGAADSAIAQFDLWIDAHQSDIKLGEAYNSRCWIRALYDRDVQKAMDDCNKAVRLRKSASTFDSRGLAYLRLADYRHAIQDYDAALKLNPKAVWSLYGRGLAELHQSQTDKGLADIDAAKGLDSNIATEAGKYGLSSDISTAR